jgi:DNA-binding response OmpR family regulator
MDDKKFRFLVMEKEYLIAIDAGELLGQQFFCDVEIATSSDLAAMMERGPWDVVLMDTDGSNADGNTAGVFLSRGAALVFLSAYRHLEKGVPGHETWPVAMKPFTPESLQYAVSSALRKVGKSAR